MARTGSTPVPEYVLVDLFDALGLWDKVDNGTLAEIEEPNERSPAQLCPGGESYYVRLRNRFGLDIARVHYISCPNGTIVRWPSALKMADVTIFRTGHEQRPGTD